MAKKRTPESELSAKLERIALLEKKLELQQGLPHLYGQKFYRWAREFFESKEKDNFLCAANQIGKGHPLEVELPTPAGFKRVGDLQVGDEVFGRDGLPTRIIDFPYEGERPCYRVTFDDGSHVDVSAEHLWSVKTYEERFRKTYTYNRGSKTGQKFPNKSYGKWKTLSTEELISVCKYSPETKAPLRAVIPIADPVEYPERPIFDPYLLGLLLGDGCMTSRHVKLSSGDAEIVDYVSAKCPVKHSGNYNYSVKGVADDLSELGLIGLNSATKFIPDSHLHASIEQRKALLAGLLDTDGSVYGKGIVEYCTISDRLKAGMIQLVTSLGGKVESIRKRKAGYKKQNGDYVACTDCWRIFIKLPFNPFRLTRKRARWYQIRYAHERLIYKIESIGKMQTRCISVAAPDSLYLATRNYIVTHNSSVQIRKAIHWATCKELWPELWHTPPVQFWYLYPTRDMANIEIVTKWEREFLPRGKYKEDPVYGWRYEKDSKEYKAIHFNSGCSIYMKAYSQNPQALQAGTCHAIFTDEELNESLYDELNLRRAATDGYFHMVFTATLGQELWRRTIEEIGTSKEKFTDAWKRQVSMYDCLVYEDGTPSHWTRERIRRIERSCKSNAEVDRRVYGRFVKDEGLRYPGFDRKHNVVDPEPIAPGWHIYAGIDVGGGGTSHPSAITLVAVSPDYSKGRVVGGVRMDGQVTTASDVLDKYQELTRGLNVTAAYYDFSAKDFGTIAARMGVSVLPAEKSHAIGEQTMNVLFKNRMLMIEDRQELEPLVSELCSLSHDVQKAHAVDDAIDSCRYAVSRIAWNWSSLMRKGEEPSVGSGMSREEADRRGLILSDEEGLGLFLDDELEAWNELYEP